MTENAITITFHGLTFGGTVLILGILLNQHKVWVRMKDRLNTLWKKHCQQTGDDYVPLENGSHRL